MDFVQIFIRRSDGGCRKGYNKTKKKSETGVPVRTDGRSNCLFWAGPAPGGTTLLFHTSGQSLTDGMESSEPSVAQGTSGGSVWGTDISGEL